MTALNELPAPAIGQAIPLGASLGRVENSQPTNEPSQPTVAASAGSTLSPQAIDGSTPRRFATAGTESTRSAISCPISTTNAPTGSKDILDGQKADATQAHPAVEEQSQPTAIQESAPTAPTLSAAISSPAAKQGAFITKSSPSGDQLPREVSDSASPRFRSPLAEQDTPPAKAPAAPVELALGVEVQGQPVTAEEAAIAKVHSPVLADPLLALAADVLDDLEKVRIANENRLRQLTRDETDSDGEERGFGLTLDHPDVARLAALVQALGKAEQDAAKNLARRLREHPLAPWLKAQKGVGDKQAARLLAAIGDPFFNTLHSRPRTVSELWAYAGYHVLPAGQSCSEAQSGIASGSRPGRLDHPPADTQWNGVGVAAKRARGQKANWSRIAKMRAFLIAESCVKQLRKTCPVDADLGFATHADGCDCGYYRKVYDSARAKYVDAVHQVPCERCGPKGKPAQPGSDLSRAHKQARALRAVAKELLKDLWREAKRIHETHAP